MGSGGADVRSRHYDTLIAVTVPSSVLANPGSQAALRSLNQRRILDIRVVLATPGYRVVAEEFLGLDAGQVAAEGIDLAHNLLRRLLDEHHIEDADVLGAGVGIPGPIDRGRSAVVGSVLPEWSDIDFASIGERLGFPVILDNDANLGALAEVASPVARCRGWGICCPCRSAVVFGATRCPSSASPPPSSYRRSETAPKRRGR